MLPDDNTHFLAARGEANNTWIHAVTPLVNASIADIEIRQETQELPTELMSCEMVIGAIWAVSVDQSQKPPSPTPHDTRCRTFVEDPAPSAQLSIGAFTLTKLKRCFAVFKAMVLDSGQALAHSNGRSGGEGTPHSHGEALGEGGGHGAEVRNSGGGGGVIHELGVLGVHFYHCYSQR